MKIAILHDSFPPHSSGGADIVAFNLAQALQKQGHEILVITTTRKSGEAGISTYEGLLMHTIATSYDLRFQAYVSLWNISVARKVKKILREFRPDVVHAHNVHGYLSYRSLTIAKKLGSRVILTCHDVMSFNYTKLTDFIDPNNFSVPENFHYRISPWHQFRINRFRYNPLRNMIIRYVLRNYVDQIIAVSDALKQALEDNGIGNVEVIHNGIDTEEWRVSSEALAVFKKKHGLGDSVVVFGGRLTGIKGGHKLLEALSKVVHTIPDTQLLIIGKEGTYTEKMRKESARFGLDGKVFFTGWIVGQELHTAYHASAIVVVPSLCFDSFPTMNLEGMACKKPIIATCFGGSRELVINNKTGYIINPYNVAILGDKITGLLENKIKNTEFGAAGYERVLQAFSLKAQVEGYEKIFKKYT